MFILWLLYNIILYFMIIYDKYYYVTLVKSFINQITEFLMLFINNYNRTIPMIIFFIHLKIYIRLWYSLKNTIPCIYTYTFYTMLLIFIKIIQFKISLLDIKNNIFRFLSKSKINTCLQKQIWICKKLEN